MAEHIDADLLRFRRAELGLSQRTLARLARLSPTTILRLEHGSNSDQLTLGHLARLADALALPPRALLSAEPIVLPSAGTIATDVAAVGAAIARRRHTVRELTDSLDLDHPRVMSALRRLSTQAGGLGLAVHRAGTGRYRLIAAAEAATTRPGTKTTVQRRSRALTISEVRVLRRIADGAPLDLPTNANELIALRSLVVAGAVVRGVSPAALTVTALASLGTRSPGPPRSGNA